MVEASVLGLDFGIQYIALIIKTEIQFSDWEKGKITSGINLRTSFILHGGNYL